MQSSAGRSPPGEGGAEKGLRILPRGARPQGQLFIFVWV